MGGHLKLLNTSFTPLLLLGTKPLMIPDFRAPSGWNSSISSDAGLGQRRSDKAARALKFDVFGQGHGCGDGLGLARGLGDGVVEGIGRVETREG